MVLGKPYKEMEKPCTVSRKTCMELKKPCTLFGKPCTEIQKPCMVLRKTCMELVKPCMVFENTVTLFGPTGKLEGFPLAYLRGMRTPSAETGRQVRPTRSQTHGTSFCQRTASAERHPHANPQPSPRKARGVPTPQQRHPLKNLCFSRPLRFTKRKPSPHTPKPPPTWIRHT